MEAAHPDLRSTFLNLWEKSFPENPRTGADICDDGKPVRRVREKLGFQPLESKA